MPSRRAEPPAEPAKKPLARFPSQDAFADWLHSLPSQSVVSRHWGYCDCPLAKWIGATRHMPVWIEPYVEGVGGAWTISGTRTITPTRKLPKWAARFVDRIDELNDEDSGFKATAADCLRALKDA